MKKFFSIFHHKKSKIGIEQIKAYNNTREKNARKYICHLPFTQMYITFGGDVLVCCGNRKFLLGKYPEESLKDIWFGNKYKELRKYIAENDLTHGCDICEQPIKNETYNLVLAKEYDRLASSTQKLPVMMEFELSNTCNLDCIMCFDQFSSTVARRHGNIINTREEIFDDEFLKQLDDFIPNLIEASFKGGEPFLIKIYHRIWERIIEKKPDTLIRLVTNITTLNDNIKSYLEQGNFYLNISIDSLQKEHYESIRRNANYEQTIENLNYLLQWNHRKGNNHITLMVCLLNENWKEMPDMIKLCNENEISLMFLYISFPALHLSLKYAGPKNLNKIYNYLSAVSFDEKNIYSVNNLNMYKNLLTQIEVWKNEAEKKDYFELYKDYRLSINSFLSEFLCDKVNKNSIENETSKFLENLNMILNSFKDSEYEEIIRKLIEYPVEKTSLVLFQNKEKDLIVEVVNNYKNLLAENNL